MQQEWGSGAVSSGTSPLENIYIHTCAHSPRAEGKLVAEEEAHARWVSYPRQNGWERNLPGWEGGGLFFLV